MRNKFDAQLAQLNQSLSKMGALCEKAIASAVKALLNGDAQLAKQARTAEQEIDQLEREIESLCMKLLLQQQPVAADLRLISAVLKMVTDMERIGDQAADIAELLEYVQFAEMQDSKAPITRMAHGAIRMVTDSIHAFVQRDMQLAHEVMTYDDVVDGLFVDIKTDLIQQISTHVISGEAALDILMIAKYLERIGDHAVNIAEWVVFAETGKYGDTLLAEQDPACG